MKNKQLDYEVDFIGDQTSLTIEEEKALNDYFKKKKIILKLNELKKPIRKTKLKSKT